MANLKTASRFRHTLLACGLAAAVLTGCTDYDWNPSAPPAAGVLLDAQGIKVRNLILVANDSGKAVLFGGVAPVKSDRLIGVTLTPISTDSKPGSPVTANGSVEVPADAATPLQVVIRDSGVTPGSTAALILHFANVGDVSLQVPILASTHPDFKKAFDEANA